MDFGHSNIKLENLENLITHRRMHHQNTQVAFNPKNSRTNDSMQKNSVKSNLVKTEIQSYTAPPKKNEIALQKQDLQKQELQKQFHDFSNQYQKSHLPVYPTIRYNWFDESASIFASVENYGMSDSFLKNPFDAKQSISWLCDVQGRFY